MTGLLQSIPALWRDRIYGVYVLAGFIIGGLQVALAAIPDTSVPQWLTITLVVYAYIGTAFVGMAKANTTALSGPPPAPADPPAPDQRGQAPLWFIILLAVVITVLVLVVVVPAIRP